MRADIGRLQERVVHSDETSWWKNSASCSLWVFATPGSEGLTLYRVVDHRDRATFHDILPPDYPGLLISDCRLSMTARRPISTNAMPITSKPSR
ncbi:MAG TPA: hypothetical protein VIT91_03010 [Chthoniobacterales bacterium]